MSLAQRLRLPENTPKPIVVAVVCYLGHLLFAPFAFSSEFWVFICLLAFLSALGRGVLRPSFHILYVPLALYGVASTMSAIAAERSIHMWADSALWGKMLLFPAALILFREVPRSHTLALRVFLFFGFGTGVVVIFQYFALGHRDLQHRVTWPASHVMTLSGMLVGVAVFALALWIHDLRNLYLFLTTAVAAFGVVLTFSRSAWLGWTVAAFALLMLRRPRALAWAVPAALIALSFAPLSFFGRMISSVDTRQSSNLDRIRMIEAGVEIIMDYPLLGVGPANVKEVYPLYRKHDAPRVRIPHLHNNLIQIWAERGVLAVSAYLMLLALFLRECWRGWRGPSAAYAEGGMAVAVALATAGLFEFNFGDTEVFWLLLDTFALVIASIERPLRSNEPSPALVPVTSPKPFRDAAVEI